MLVESVDVKTQAFADLFFSYGTEIVAKVTDFHLANGGISRYEKFRHFYKEFLSRNLSQNEERELDARFSSLVVDKIVSSPWVEGAEEFLNAWHKRIPLYIASGTPQEELRRIVQRRKMHQYFAGVHGSPASKGEILTKIIEEGRHTADRTLMIGDAVADLDGALEAGVAFLARVSPKTPDVFGKRNFPKIGDLTELKYML